MSEQPKRTVGLCTIIAFDEMAVVTYVCSTYELALAQARENMRGVEGPVQQLPEQRDQSGLRETTFRLPEHFELVQVREVEVGDAVLPVKGRMAEIVQVPQ